MLFALLAAVLLAVPQSVRADEAGGDEAQTPIVETGAVSDGDTRYTYDDNLGNENSTQYNGRVWADKTVSTEDLTFTGADTGETKVEIGDSDFLIAYSALATSTEVTTTVPADVVFVLDFSASMAWGTYDANANPKGQVTTQEESRIQALVDAVNEAIDELVVANPENRIGIVVFNSTSEVMLDLTTVERRANKDYLSITEWNATRGQDDGNGNVKVTCNINGHAELLRSVTNIHAGLYTGMNMLANEKDTTYTDGQGNTVTRIPNVILMSDGAPTTFSAGENGTENDSSNTGESGSWWEGITNAAIGRGDNDNPHSGNGFMPLLTASYLKNKITEHYYGDASSDEGQAHIYTIGFKTSEQSQGMSTMADTVLNPAARFNENGAWISTGIGAVDEIGTAWAQYSQGGSATVHYQQTSETNESTYTVFNAANGDPANNPTSLVYNDAYYSADNSSALESVFAQIINDITSNAKSPTQTDPSSPTTSGYITYTDVIGQYMQVDDVKTLIFSGKRFDNPQKSTSEVDGVTTTTYMFSGEIESPVYGSQNASSIVIELVEDASGNQTLTVKIPAAAIPLRVTSVELSGETVTSYSSNGAYPLRLLYTVSMRDGVIADDGTVDTSAVTSDYIAANSTEDGSIAFYSNEFTRATDASSATGQATVEFTPASDNPFYFVQEDALLYTSPSLDSAATGEFDSLATYYFPETYYVGDDGGTGHIETTWVERSGATLKGYTKTVNGQLAIAAGSPRMGNLEDLATPKTANKTGTDESVLKATYADGSVTAVLGNNGRLLVSYVPEETDVDPDEIVGGITKQVLGNGTEEAMDPSGYTFELSVKNVTDEANPTEDGFELPESSIATSDAEGNVDFDAVTFTAAGIYEVTVKEIVPAEGDDGYDPHVTYDGHSLTYRVEVTDENGALSAKVVEGTLDTGESLFTNVYTADDPKSVFGTDGEMNPTVDIDGQAVGVGDVLTYTVNWVNNAVAENGAPAAATVVVRDTVPTGTSLHDADGNLIGVSEGGELKTDESGNEYIEWTFEDQAPGASGTVSFQVVVTDAAVSYGSVSNQATISIGSNAGTTNTVANPVKSGMLTISKTVSVAEGDAPANADQEFAFTVTLTDADGAALEGEFSFSGTSDGVTPYTGTVSNGGTVTLKNGGSVTVSDLPAGTGYAVAEAPVAGYTADEQQKTGTIASGGTSVAAFANTYATGSVDYDARVSIGVTKVLNGRAMSEGQFGFNVVPADQASADKLGIDLSGVALTAPAASDGEKVSMPLLSGRDVTFTQGDIGKTYIYTVSESIPDEVPAGYTYDADVFTLTIDVSDNGDGTITARTTVSNGKDYTVSQSVNSGDEASVSLEIPFVNTYKLNPDASASVTLAGHKTLENGTLNAGDFHFVLDPETEDDSDGNFGFASNDADGDFSFTLSYDAASLDGAASKVFTYDVYEMLGGSTVNGIAYDGTRYTVEVTVTDNGDGTIGAEITGIVRDDGTAVLPGDDGAYVLEFANTYTGSDTTSVAFGLQKVLNGRDLAADDGFNFEVRTYSVETGLAGDVVASGNTQGMTAADGTAVEVETTRVGFDADDMAEADAAGRVTDNGDGTRTARFDFAIAEVVGDNLNVGYSDATYYATVLVRDDGNGNLSVESVTYYRDAALTDALGEGELPTFTNTYLPEATNFTLTGTKTTVAAEGATVPDGLSFSYDVYRVDADGSEAYLTSATSPANGTFTATIPVDGVGTYTYRIAESRGGTVQGSVEYDGTVYYLVLSAVRDEATGVLQFSPTYYRGSVAEENRLADGEQVAFTNVYGGTDGATVQLSGTKTLSGDATLSDLAPFTFSVTDVTDADNPQSVGNGVSSADGTIAFPTLTYTYYLQEQAAADGTVDDGASDVAVETEGDGTSELADAENIAEGVQEDGGAGSDGPLGSEGAEAGGATDADTDGSLTDDGAVADGSGTPTDGSDQAGATGEPDQTAPDPVGSSDAGADVADDPSLSASAENSDADGGSVADPEAGAENADVQTASLLDLFTVSEAIADDAAAETVSADVPSRDDILDAVASGGAEGGADVGSVATEPDAADDAAAVSEGASSDPEIVSGDLGDHRYVIAENIPADATQNDDGTWTSSNGVTYDGTRYLVTVNVSAAYDAATQAASMTAAVTEILRSDSYGNFDNATTVDSIAFSNSYRASEPAAVSLTGTKTLSGRTMEEGEFSFEVYEGDTLVTTGTNAADGTIDFATFRVSEPGTHTYTVVETDGGEGGVVYDETTYQVTVEVTDNLDGTLSAEVVYPEGGIVFSNAYSTDGAVATANLTGTKTLTGRAMEAGEFRFTVTETVDGVPTVVAYGENEAAADGEAAPIDFTPIQYGEVGEHDYTVTELAGSADGVTYDTASFRVHVGVVDNGDGTLAANVSYPDGDVAFANAYEEPVEPGDADEPGTGEPDGGSGSGNGGDGTIPRTGDPGEGLAGAAALALGGLGATALGGGALLRRRASRR